ncbi:MAG: hypothetical protein EB084_10825, partial [Proteobacteria bacterium]|nr:hypothetical protein [Pseudomonadota bacterium]
PQRALDEADRQLKLVDRQTKALIEESLYLLLHDLAAMRRKPDDAVFRRTFERQHEALHDLLMRLNRKTLSTAQRQALRFNLALLTGYGEMQLQALSLLRTLTEGQSSLGYVFPSPWRALVTDYQTAFDGAWLRVHYRSTIEPQEADQLRATCQALRERYFNEISGDVSVSPPVQSWLHDIISRLEQVAAALFTLAETAAAFPDVHVPDVSEDPPVEEPPVPLDDDGALEAEAV